MKRLSIIAILFILLVPVMVFAAAPGSVVQTNVASYVGGTTIIRFVCTASADDGTIPNTALSTANMAMIIGTRFLYNVTAYPTSGGTAPDAADVQILMNGMDLLGGKGVNLIHATATQDTAPYSSFMADYRYPRVTGTLTLAVANQATHSANYTIELVFER